MQTFLPYADFEKSARSLDRMRLGKQRVETLQLLRGSWPHHPASKMWRGHLGALREYGIVVCSVWRERGYKDTCLEKIQEIDCIDMAMPLWFGREDFHLSHRSNLIRKNPEFYQPQFLNTPSNLPYIWPV